MYSISSWLSQIVSSVANSGLCGVLADDLGSVRTDNLLAGLAIAANLTTIALGVKLIISRLRALEQSGLLNLYAWQLDCALAAIVLQAMIISAALIASDHRDHPALLGFIGLVILQAIITASVILYDLARSTWAAKVASRAAPDNRKKEIHNIYKELLRETICLLTMGFTSFAVVIWGANAFGILTQLGDPRTQHFGVTQKVVSLFDALCNQWYALELSGAVSGAAQGAARRAAANNQRKRRWREAEQLWLKSRGAKREVEMEQWDEKVFELAGRGISLDALLAFYGKLGKLMPHFDPTQHTTNDVVRAAIVPYSAPTMSACATVLMGGQYTRPSKMVTHNWSNLFRDLVAAILADALGENEFEMITELLMTDLQRLEKWVTITKSGGRTYWVCAFAVNQHTGICGSVFPDARDTVSRIRPKPCKCTLMKAWNSTEPMLPDGRGIPCEMNKFDDMMKFLSATNPNFEQVVAIDAKFCLFSRAWCVAEIATANSGGMIQRLKIYSSEAFAEHSERMRTLRVQDMEASRPEDKQEILNGIPDVEAFNLNLRKLLFEDLFPAWSSLDAEERMTNAGVALRWMPVWVAPILEEERTAELTWV